MNIQLQEALADILSRAVSGMEAGIQFLSEELPDVINQLLLWKLLESLLPMLISIVLLILFSLMLYSIVNSYRKDPYRQAENERDKARELWFKAPSGDSSTKAREVLRERERALELLEDNSGAYATAFGVSLILVVLTAIITSVQSNLIWLQILVAPKIYLIEYASSLVK